MVVLVVVMLKNLSAAGVPYVHFWKFQNISIFQVGQDLCLEEVDDDSGWRTKRYSAHHLYGIGRMGRMRFTSVSHVHRKIAKMRPKEYRFLTTNTRRLSAPLSTQLIKVESVKRDADETYPVLMNASQISTRDWAMPLLA